jgi:rare lipoprotein A
MIFNNQKNTNPLLLIAIITSLIVTSFSEVAMAKTYHNNLKSRKRKANSTWLKKQSLEPNLLSNRNLTNKNNQKKLNKKYSNNLPKSESNLSQEKGSLLARSLVGKASWYGPNFHGRPTASGEIFDQNSFTAAHPSLQFGTQVRVTNLNNGRSVIVRINDRGPFVHNRIIDLSKAAASTIGLVNSGVAPVQIEVLGQ